MEVLAKREKVTIPEEIVEFWHKMEFICSIAP